MLRSQEFNNNTPNRESLTKASKSAKKIISSNKSKLHDLSRGYNKHKNKIQSSFEAHLKKLNTLKRKTSQSNYIKPNTIGSKKFSKKDKNKTARLSETAPRKIKPISYFEHKSTFNTPHQKNYQISKFQMSNILDNRNQKSKKNPESDKCKKKSKKKGKKKKNLKKKPKGNIIPPGIVIEAPSPRSDFMTKFKYDKKTKFRSSYKTPLDQNIGFFSFNNNNKSKSKGFKAKSKNTTGDFIKNFPLKRTPLFEVEEKKETKPKVDKAYLKRGANSPIFKKMGKFLRTQNEDSFKLTNPRHKGKDKKSSKSYLQINKSKRMIKKISIRELGVKSNDRYRDLDKKLNNLGKKKRGKKFSVKRESHSRSPQALKKNIINKISLPYKPVDFASFDLKRTKNISTSKKFSERHKIEDVFDSKVLKDKICPVQKVLFISEGKSKGSNNNSKVSLGLDKETGEEMASQGLVKKSNKHSISKSMRDHRKDR